LVTRNTRNQQTAHNKAQNRTKREAERWRGEIEKEICGILGGGEI
jgi:hypothetical protein